METGQPPASSVPNEPSVAVLILNWNGRSLLQTCLPLMLNQTYANYEVVVVDNGSSDDSARFVRERFPRVQLIQNKENLGFSRGINAGLRQIQADVVVLLNNDVLVQPNWLAELIRPFHQDPQIGIVGCKLLYPDGTIQHLGAELTYPLAHSRHFHYKEPDVSELPAVQEVPYVTGAALAVHQKVQAEIGLLDESFHPFYYEEVDYCYRARAAGYRVVVATKAVAIHNESASMRKVQDAMLQTRHRNRYRFVLKHYSLDQFFQAFVPAETAYLNTHHLFPDVDAVRLACLEIAIAAPKILPADIGAEQLTAVQKALLQLREAAVQARASAESPPPELEEFSFTRSRQGFGMLIASFRQAWSNVAAKWLVRRLRQQQTLYNQFLLRQIERLETQGRSQAMEIEHLLATLLPAQASLKHLETELMQIKQQLDQTDTENNRP
ncbi:MAG: glycosyltransferase family 2 protein [Anaerolineaceae bacterium]|nr:glycosyltransferase family 2 protein [Anaerolineaceae bacterium]